MHLGYKLRIKIYDGCHVRRVVVKSHIYNALCGSTTDRPVLQLHGVDLEPLKRWSNLAQPGKQELISSVALEDTHIVIRADVDLRYNKLPVLDAISLERGSIDRGVSLCSVEGLSLDSFLSA